MKTRRDYLTIICTLILICILLLGIFAPLITSYNPNTINVANPPTNALGSFFPKSPLIRKPISGKSIIE